MNVVKISRNNVAIGAGIAGPALLLLASCTAKSPTVSASLQPAVSTNSFVGNEECRGCHAAEFEAHHGSRHDITLRPMDRESLGSQSPEPGKIGNSGYELTDMGVKYGFGLVDEQTYPLQLTFGSGKS